MATESKSEVRERVLREHAELRQGIAELMDRLQRGDLERSRPRLFAMLRELHSTLTQEASTLPALLSTTDAWGPTRAVRLDRANTLLRLDIARLFADLEESALSDADMLEPILRKLDEALASAEREALSEEALRDDPILIDYGGG